MITGINESKTLTKHISCECKCKFDGTKCNSNQWWNNDKDWCECIKNRKNCDVDRDIENGDLKSKNFTSIKDLFQ